ncbi:MAG: hypothetical protein GQ564_17525 [Bacteroidales bacterium]|nr:hypothetical protein [Bacteroidales bacterium]
MDIKLNFINNSNDQNNSEIVFFQKNVASDFNDTIVAWKVVKNCATGWHHNFNFTDEMAISATDSWGNEIVSPIPACNGQSFYVFKDSSGDQLAYNGQEANKDEVELKNDLTTGSISANIYKGGKLLATKTGVSPGQKAAFQFKPSLWVAVVSQVQEGEIMNSAIISDINTELSLLGLESADIVMTGGGIGPNASKLEFALENIKYDIMWKERNPS